MLHGFGARGVARSSQSASRTNLTAMKGAIGAHANPAGGTW